MKLSFRFNTESEKGVSKAGVQFIIPLIASILDSTPVIYQTKADTHEDGSVHIRTTYEQIGEMP